MEIWINIDGIVKNHKILVFITIFLGGGGTYLYYIHPTHNIEKEYDALTYFNVIIVG